MSIEDIYKGIIDKLTERGKIVDISSKLASLNNNADRVLYVYKVIEELKLFPNVINVGKSKSVSVHYRNLGNQCYKKSEDSKAWQYYNLSLLHAPFDSEAYTLAYSNRSAVFYSMKKYKECLKDINKALSLNYSDKLKPKLLKRQLACEEALNIISLEKDLNVNEFSLDLKGPRDPIYLCASNKLQVVCNKEMGRHVIAKEDINVGEVLVQENPYMVLLLKAQYLFACSYCLSRDLNLFPCDKCCFALYCSEVCKEKAWKDYHGIECPLMATLVDMQFTKLELLGLRTVVKARNDHDSWSSLFQTIKAAEALEATEYRGCVKINEEWIYDSKYYASIHSLASNIDKRNISDIFQKCVTAAVFLKLLEEATNFLNSDKETEAIRKCVAGTLLHHIMTSPTNMHGISGTMQNRYGQYLYEVSIASAAYAYHSLINHSCCPNVVRSTKIGSSEMSLIALRPIKKGMQIFDNYGYHHAIDELSTRQTSLKFQYKFACECEACVDHWPMYLDLVSANLPTPLTSITKVLLSQSSLAKLQSGDKETAIELFGQLCDLAEKLESYAPCVQLADCQESLKQCLVIIDSLITFRYGGEVEWNAIPPKV